MLGVMPGTITVRLDAAAEKALVELTSGGSDRSEAIRGAVIEAADRRRRERLRSEAAALAADSDDRAEIEAVQKDMGALRAW